MTTKQAFARTGSTKKQQLMEAMIKRIGHAGNVSTPKPSTAGPGKASATDRPREPHTAPGRRERVSEAAKAQAPVVPEVVKKKYSMDYSRFDQVLDESDEEDETSPHMGSFPRGPPRDLHKRMPAKFLEAMRFNEEAQRRGNKPEDLVKAEKMFQEAFQECSPEARSEIWDMLNAGGAGLPDELKKNFLGP